MKTNLTGNPKSKKCNDPYCHSQGKPLPASEFWKNKQNKDDLCSKCKRCMKGIRQNRKQEKEEEEYREMQAAQRFFQMNEAINSIRNMDLLELEQKISKALLLEQP